MDGRGFNFELIVVDDGSNDATARIVADEASRDPRIRLLKNDKNRGKGYSVRHGIGASAGDIILFSDADLSTPIEEFDKLFRNLERFDVVIASRSLPDSNVVVHQPFYREYMGKAFNLLVRIALVGGIIDTQCGFKLMTRQAADAIVPLMRIDSFSFDVELILVAKRRGLGVKDVPVTWIDSKGSRVHPIRDSLYMLLDLLRIKLYDLLDVYGKLSGRE